MRPPRFALAFAAAMGIGWGALAESPVVVELFTSQGCSSCPPADALMAEIAGRDDVIALSLHVDYWDYIGWKDGFANPAFTQRQRGYARAAGAHSIYTPQFVVNGRDHVVGFKPMKLARLIERHKAAPAFVDLSARREGDRLVVTATSQRPFGKRAILRLARILPDATVTIERGENAGRTIVYHAIVKDMVEVGDWDGRKPLRLALDVPPGETAVLLQAHGMGPILAAARVD